MEKPTVQEVLDELKLVPLVVEGGYFNEIYRSKMPSSNPSRCCGTSIYFLLDDKSVSRFHLLSGADEIWFYHAGSPAVQILLFPDGHWEKTIIGPDILKGQRPQSIIPAGTWQGAILLDKAPGSWGLFGAVCYPGFEYDDYTEKSAEELFQKWPEAKQTIIDLGLNV